ncbi:protein kinase [Archangium violaceum]|uniref:protein kinase domain-containing protein n=1 Tax=Archangium violaceum TaxID=83451 RepID=UPI002B2A0163|nr:protein kinase [Archangium violaceum]
MPSPDEDKPLLDPAQLREDTNSPVEPTVTVGPLAAAPAAPVAATGGSAVASGASWDRYEFLELLGRGGMGEVYKARDRRLDRTVALKFIRGEDPDRAVRFLREARAQARIDHPNVCKVHEAGEVGGKAYIAMQLVKGQRLDQAAAGMSLPERLQVMREVAAGVHEAHRLGIIHRDLKPSNIMVERGEDGRLSPVVMDFGLAYEVTQGHGLTETGTLMGTPSYMAPEQARGELRNIDRRSDVYSLGATLYELLTGVAPFTGDTLVDILAKVLHEEPLPPRARVPHLESELETIVLKCLSKEPDQRYSSARALAEDLGRYIDGDPILGQRPSLRYRLRRYARKHRTLVAVSGVSLACILLLSALSVRSWLEARQTRRQSEARARLAEDLGQQAKEIEWFLRIAYVLPLHDPQQEQQRVRERMARISAQKHDLGAYGDGIIHYALGRGHLVLQEFEKANQELTRAREMGMDSPPLHYAHGRVLGELYHRGLEDARRSGDTSWVARRRQELEKQYLEPALQSLERSQGLELDSPRYLEGLIAFYRRDYDRAARAAAQAIVEAPWMYEARKLAGDVAYLRAVEQLEHGDYDRARAGLQEASHQYEQAVERGQSDAGNYEALAAVWMQHAEVDRHLGRSPREALERVLEATRGEIRVAPLRSTGYTQKAYALWRWFRMVRSQRNNPELESILGEWIAAGSRAVELNPRDVYAYDALGLGYYTRGQHEARNERDPHPAWAEARARFIRALELQPAYPWGLNDLALVHFDQGDYLREHGQDPRAEYAEAIRYFEQAVRFDPDYRNAYSNLTALYSALAAYSLSRGLNPEAEVRKALQAGERSLTINNRFYTALNNLAGVNLLQARYLMDADGDPRPFLEQALQHAERALSINPRFGFSHSSLAEAHVLTALQLLRAGQDPSDALASGRRALESAYRYSPDEGEFRTLGARLGMVAAEWARRQGRSGLPQLQQALEEARHAVKLQPTAGAHQELARVCWRLTQAQPPDKARGALAEGLAQVELALERDPNLAPTHAIHGGLLLARARMAREGVERRDSARQARSSFARATGLNPLLRREYEEPMREAEELSTDSPAARDAVP